MTYWCPYCGKPVLEEKAFLKSWVLQSNKGGPVILYTMWKCQKCKRKFRTAKREA